MSTSFGVVESVTESQRAFEPHRERLLLVTFIPFVGRGPPTRLSVGFRSSISAGKLYDPKEAGIRVVKRRMSAFAALLLDVDVDDIGEMAFFLGGGTEHEWEISRP